MAFTTRSKKIIRGEFNASSNQRLLDPNGRNTSRTNSKNNWMIFVDEVGDGAGWHNNDIIKVRQVSIWVIMACRDR